MIDVVGPLSGEGGKGATESFGASAVGCQPDPHGWSWLASGGVIVEGGGTADVGIRWSSIGEKTVVASNSSCGDASDSLVLEIVETDLGLGPPSLPINVQAEALSSTEVLLSWEDTSDNEDGFRLERLGETGWELLGIAPADATSATVSLAGIPFPTETPTTLRVVSFNSAGDSLGDSLLARGGSSETTATTTAEPCDSDTTLCLLGKRFRIETEWQAPNIGAGRGLGRAISLTEDTGYFWFFSPENVEVVVKVLDGRGITGKYWVFFGALSNVEYVVRVTDTETGNTREYFNPSGLLASVGDTGALPSESFLAGGIEPQERRSWESLTSRGAREVDFRWLPDPGQVGTEILFEDRSIPPAPNALRSWTFGDGTNDSVGSATTLHSYSQPGSYEVTLTVIDGPVAGGTILRLRAR